MISIATLFNTKAKLWIDGRKNWAHQLKSVVNINENWVWFHCSSFGEFEDFYETLHLFKIKHPSKKILLTFYSPSGYESLKNTPLADYVMYMPLDTPKNATQFLDIVNPEAVFFSRSDLWLNFLTILKKRKINTYLIALSLTTKSQFLKWPQRYIYRNCFDTFSKIYCQSELTKNILIDSFNISTSLVVGNTRIDRIIKSSQTVDYPIIQEFKDDYFCVIVGSCLEVDEQIILKTISDLKNLPIKWLIVPHEINTNKIAKVVKQNPHYFTQFSSHQGRIKDYKVMYIDFVGGLKHIYRYSNYAIIGGGFDKIGIHNIIEPSIYGVETAFGPNHRNYTEAIDLINLSASTVFSTSKELTHLIKNRFNNQDPVELKNKIKNYVFKNSGASQTIIDDLTKFIK